MGEYARYRGERIKIGTCEDMLYLRADQAHLVQPVGGSFDPVRDGDQIYFRFPFPDEDAVAPGEFDSPDRGFALPATAVPDGVEHQLTQFVSHRGYSVMLPCPEGPDAENLVFRRDTNPAAVRIVQQRLWQRALVTVCECGGCGVRYRLGQLSDAEPLIAALHTMAENDPEQADTCRAMAERVRQGYTQANGWSQA